MKHIQKGWSTTSGAADLLLKLEFFSDPEMAQRAGG